LPRALRIAEVDFHFRVYRESFVLGHFQPAIPGQRAPQSCEQLANVLAQRGDHGGRIFAGHLDQHGKSRMTFYERCDVAVLGVTDEVTFPMAGDGAVLDLCGSFPNGNSVDDLALDVKVYFCDPQSPWQRGSNENTNGLLRQYFPKRTDLSVYSQEELDEVALRLNQRPRKTLGFQTPADRLQASVALTC